MENGELRKSIDTVLDIFSNIIVDSKLFYFGSKQDTVNAINHVDGTLLWQRLMSSEIMSISKSSDSDEVLYVRTNDSKISSIDVNTGKFLWVNSQLPPTLSIRGSSPALPEDDKVIVGFEDAKIVAFNSEVGSQEAYKMTEVFLECIIAPSFTNEAIEIFSKKKILKILNL